MSGVSEPMTEPAPESTLGSPGPKALPWTRLFYWSVRRELWENRGLYLAPAAVAGVVILGFLLGSGGLVRVALKRAAG